MGYVIVLLRVFRVLHFPQVLSYVDVLRGKAKVGRRVAIIGAGGIGFDVSEYLLSLNSSVETPPKERRDDVRSFLKVTKPHETNG